MSLTHLADFDESRDKTIAACSIDPSYLEIFLGSRSGLSGVCCRCTQQLWSKDILKRANNG